MESIKRSPDTLVYTSPGVTPYADAQFRGVKQDGVPLPPPVLGKGYTAGSISDALADVVLKRPVKPGWLLGLAIAFCGVLVLNTAVGYLFWHGVGTWGINMPVAWGFAIVNFVWWVGIAHAGTFISAFLLLLRQDWRTSINRFTEAMTLFSVSCAGMFPLFHVGRPWLAYWLLPYPNTMLLWPQFRSPLAWDVFAVSTYATVSLLFWYTGLIPDLAQLRDQASHPALKFVYGVLALGWRGSARHWQRYNSAYILLAGLAAPLVVSVHSIVGMDFAAAQVPGWHSTIFPPYFVAGAIFSGFAMVLTCCIPLRKFYNLEAFITLRHIENCAKLMLVTGMIVAYGYTMEWVIGWYSGNTYEWFMNVNRAIGPYWVYYWMLILCNIALPQLMWFKPIRQNLIIMWLISVEINVGMWLERFVIVVISLSRDFMVSSWGHYTPTRWDIMLFAGTLGWFFTLVFIFIRVLPAISIFEMRELVHEEAHGRGH
jgi:molybdopterin-containing oxidoreductase family membrane subunit